MRPIAFILLIVMFVGCDDQIDRATPSFNGILPIDSFGVIDTTGATRSLVLDDQLIPLRPGVDWRYDTFSVDAKRWASDYYAWLSSGPNIPYLHIGGIGDAFVAPTYADTLALPEGDIDLYAHIRDVERRGIPHGRRVWFGCSGDQWLFTADSAGIIHGGRSADVDQVTVGDTLPRYPRVGDAVRSYDGSIVARWTATGTIETPAGTFVDCIACTAGNTRLWFKRGVGVVKSEWLDGETVVGGAWLVWYRVPAAGGQ